MAAREETSLLAIFTIWGLSDREQNEPLFCELMVASSPPSLFQGGAELRTTLNNLHIYEALKPSGDD